MNQVIEPEFKHEVRADIEVRDKIHQHNTNLVANVFANVEVPPNFPRNPVRIHKASTVNQQRPEGPAVRPNEDEQLINKGKAVYNKCIQVLNKMGFPEDQGSQICQLLTETMLLTQQEQVEEQPNNSPGNNPAGNATDTRSPPSGQIASNCAKTASALDRELEILRSKQEKLDIELAKERQGYQNRVARITSLEKQNHRLGLEQYLRQRMNDESMISYYAMKYASKGFTVDDLKDIYEDIPARTARVQIPKSKVRLRTASTDEYNNNDRHSHIQHTNDKFTNAYFGNTSSDHLSDNYIG